MLAKELIQNFENHLSLLYFKKQRLLSQTAFASILAFSLIIILLYSYNIFTWRNFPDFGYGYRIATGFNVVADLTAPGQKAGMLLGDRILKVNGKDFTTFQEFRAAMNRKLGDTNTYLVERDKRKVQISLVNLPVGIKRAFTTSGLSYLVGFCYILIGILVFLMKPHHRASWAFFIFSNIFGLLIIFIERAGVLRPFWLETLEIFSYTFTPATFLHLAFSFPDERTFLKRHPLIQLLPYIASGLLFLSIRSVTPTMGDAPKILIFITLLYLVTGVLLFLGSCLQLWLTSPSDIVKLRSKMILGGFGIAASLPLSDFVINVLFHFYLVPSAKYYLPFMIIFPLSVAYSIVKYNLFEIDAIIKCAYGYALTSGAVAGAYALFIFLSNMVSGRYGIAGSPVFSLIFILSFVFLFNPLRNRLQKLIDRFFYRLEYDYQKTVQRISEVMRSLMNLDQIGKNILNTALDIMFIDYGCVILLNKEKQVYECLAAREEITDASNSAKFGGLDSERKILTFNKGRTEELSRESDEWGKSGHMPELKIPIDDPLIKKIAERKRELTIYDLQEDPFFDAERTLCKKTFDLMKATLLVPLIYEEKLIGLISLGNKKSGKFYRQEDINLLNTLANQGTVAIENAWLLEEVLEKERMEEQLAIARDLQASMLPAHCPEIEGFKIAALCLPAREVGGDFFDFIGMGRNRLGIAIGDVTGKSISGALVMAASRSVFRVLSEEKSAVGDIMCLANRRLKKDIRKGMFVAMLYMVLDPIEYTIRLCSAGQTRPIYLSSKTIEFVETKGDSFPLGILDDVDYQETLLQLAYGDKIVLYTDGVVEAMNERQEMFGFDRLLEVIRESRSLTADMLLKKIIDMVRKFTGNASQHDDLTVIVLSAPESKSDSYIAFTKE